MSVVADFSVPAEAFCLGDALAAVPEATAELDRLVAHSPKYVMPFVWILDADCEAFAAAAAADPTVADAEVTDSFDDANLFQITWADEVAERLQSVLDHEGVVLEARGSDGEWRLWVRFGSREHFSEFEAHFRRYGEVTLHQLSRPQIPGGEQYGVTSKQREALLAAYDAGYYETPSATSGEAIAADLGVSQQSVSNRLRRGVNALIENTLGRYREE
ncbi:MAG: bacterio-opsin activator domain-containing protein [Haloarculaceae archaeon]